MIELFTESNKSLDRGFVLSEQELKKFSELSLSRLNELGIPNPDQSFQVKYVNGSVVIFSNVNDVLTIENSGSNKIIRLTIITSESQISKSNSLNDPTNSYILICFNDISATNDKTADSIQYKISGIKRDWVMLTASLIEEKLRKIRRLGKKFLSFFSFGLMSLVLGLVLVEDLHLRQK
jgi:hypothetical protein